MATEFRTRWFVQTSPAYDALCLLNVLTGDPFYTDLHPGLYGYWWGALEAGEQEAFLRLSQGLRQEQRSIISARLCLIYSAVSPSSLDDLIGATIKPQLLFDGVRRSPYFDAQEWDVFDRMRPELLTVLGGLQRLGFEAWYDARVMPSLLDAVHHIGETLRPLDVVREVESELGRPGVDPRVEVVALAFTSPHGMKLIGNRLIVASTWSPATAAWVAAHELMHPPYDLADPEMAAAVAALRADPFVLRHFQDHDPVFGYNTWEGYVEENCVRALDQVIAERLGVAQPAWARWAEGDGGMHVLAAVLHSLLRDRPDRRQPFGRWFAQQVQSGALRAGGIKARYHALASAHTSGRGL